MSRPGLLVALLLVWTPIHASASGEFTSPSPKLLYQMQKQNRSQPRLWVTTESTHLDLHVPTIDAAGLRGASWHGSRAPAPALIPWESIERIDEVRTGTHQGRIIGGVLGAATGLVFGNPLSAEDGVIGAVALGGLGFWFGGRIGKSHEHEALWYAAERSSVPDSGQAADQPVLRVSDLLPPRVVSTPYLTRPHGLPATAPLSTSSRAKVLRACEKIDASDLIRMRGDFGYFQGHASVVGPQGFEGLRNSAPRPIGPDASLELVTWDRIRSVDRRGNAAKRGAVTGAVAFGVLGAWAGAGLTNFEGDATPLQMAGGAAYGAVIVGSVGAVFGALVGWAIPAWHNVYRAR